MKKENLKIKGKGERGITLIALVVTIAHGKSKHKLERRKHSVYILYKRCV